MTGLVATTRVRVAAAAFVVALVAAPVAASAQPAGGPLTNLEHLSFLYTEVDPPRQEGHDTWRLEEEPEIGVLWTYAEPDGQGAYERVGGGAYDPGTDTYGQGAYNADDISRAAVVYLRHWRQFGDEPSREHARELLRGLTYLQTASGPDAGNVVLWMQPDGTLNRSAEPPEQPDPSDSDASYWLARTIWALGEGYVALRDADPDFAAFLQGRLLLAIDAVERQVLEPGYGEYQIVDGLRWPAWLIMDGADASAEAVYGLSAYVAATGDETATEVLRKLSEGVAAMPLGDATRWPFGAIMPWAQSRSVWHAWGDEMAGALAVAGTTLGQREWIDVAIGEVGRFTPHLLAQGGPENGWLPAPIDETQIAYGADVTLRNLLRTAEAADRPGFGDLAGIAAAWYFGNNPAGEPMYDPTTGRTFDGVTGDGEINRNSGAESTIHGLLSMLELDASRQLAERAMMADRHEQVTWQLVEAESGTLRGDAAVVTPESSWTGESQWSGGSFVEMGRGGHVEMPVEVPVTDGYLIMPVFERQVGRRWKGRTLHRIGGRYAGLQFHGAAGDQGITPTPGYLDLGTPRVRPRIAAGATTTTARYIGAGDPVRLDAVLVQPQVEWLVLGGDTGGQAVLRSFARREQTRTVTLPAGETATARVYDQKGRLVSTLVGDGSSVEADVVPGGFTIVSGDEPPGG